MQHHESHKHQPCVLHAASHSRKLRRRRASSDGRRSQLPPAQHPQFETSTAFAATTTAPASSLHHLARPYFQPIHLQHQPSVSISSHRQPSLVQPFTLEFLCSTKITSSLFAPQAHFSQLLSSALRSGVGSIVWCRRSHADRFHPMLRVVDNILSFLGDKTLYT